MAPASAADASKSPGLTRRKLLIGGGAGTGLILAWGLWPRHYEPNLTPAPGETILNAFLKIGADSKVTVIVPQAELGQGVWTALPQALADELGADWRQVAVEPAPINPIYANLLLTEEAVDARLPRFLRGLGSWAAHEFATREALMVTAGSTSIRAFEAPFREAGAFARALLSMAAGARIAADWRACDTEAGFVVRGNDRFRFGELAAEAARHRPPARPPLRDPGEGEISGKPMPRLDLPAKLDGSVQFAGDIRLPGLVHAAIRHGPLGDTRPARVDAQAAKKLPGVIDVIEGDRWVAAIADNGWAAERAVEVAAKHFQTSGDLVSRASIAGALDTALGGGGTVWTSAGKGAAALGGQGVIEAHYEVPLAAHAAIESLVATARISDGRVEIWMPSQAPGLARAAVAAATGYRTDRITLYPTQAGGGFGRKLECDAAVEAALIAIKAERPVQLMWSRPEEMQRARHRPPAKARLRARLEGQHIAAWEAIIAAPATAAETAKRLTGHSGPVQAALDGAVPPYAIPALAIAHAPADIGIETGVWRSEAHSYTGFFTESFVDELAAAAKVDPLSFRMSHLGGAPRLARCLSRAAAAGGWSGEPDSGQGLTVHSAFGSHIALLAEVSAKDGKDGREFRVERLVATVDCGRLINPDIARQQVEGALIWGLAATFGGAVHYDRGLVAETSLDALRLPRLADTPEIAVEFVASREAPGGLAELGVPVVAPAIANAIFSATGRRLRTLPFA